MCSVIHCHLISQGDLVCRKLKACQWRAGPMLEEDGKEFNERWGYLSRAGLNDKSQFTRQIEKYAGVTLIMHSSKASGHSSLTMSLCTFWQDIGLTQETSSVKAIHLLGHGTFKDVMFPGADIYTSRVCNLFRYTPYAYFRSPSQSLAHDRDISPRSAVVAEHHDWAEGSNTSAAKAS